MGAKVFDGTSNRSPSTCPKTPQEAFFASEEAEAPCPWKAKCSAVAVLSTQPSLA